MTKKFIILIIVLLLLTLSGYIFFNQYEKNHANEIILHGNVDIRQVDLGFRVSGKLSAMKFEEGDLVKKGDVLAQLDKVPFELEHKKQKSEVNVSLANLTKFQKGNRPQEVQEAYANVNEKEVAYNNAKKRLERQTELYERKWVSKQAYDDAFAQANEAQAQLETAKQALKLKIEGFRSEDIEVAKAQFETAQVKLAIATTNLEDTTLVAPSDGYILTRIREPGSILSMGAPVYSLSLIDPIWIRAYISEKNLGHIKPGQKVFIYTDSYPDKPYTGQIGFISPQAEFTPKNIETTELRTELVYRVRIIVQEPGDFLRQGMPVTVKLKPQQDHA